MVLHDYPAAADNLYMLLPSKDDKNNLLHLKNLHSSTNQYTIAQPRILFFILLTIWKLLKSGCSFGEIFWSIISVMYKCTNVGIYNLDISSEVDTDANHPTPEQNKEKSQHHPLHSVQTFSQEIFLFTFLIDRISVFRTLKKVRIFIFIITRLFFSL